MNHMKMHTKNHDYLMFHSMCHLVLPFLTTLNPLIVVGIFFKILLDELDDF